MKLEKIAIEILHCPACGSRFRTSNFEHVVNKLLRVAEAAEDYLRAGSGSVSGHGEAVAQGILVKALKDLESE